MWIFTVFGFFSVTQVKDKPGTLQIRARVREDLDNLRSKYLPSLSETIQLPGRDYPYRGYASNDDVALAISRAILDINFDNFKNEVIHTQGLPRELLYAKVWSVMYKAEDKLAEEEAIQAARRKNGFGKVNFDPFDDIIARNSRDTQPEIPFSGHGSTRPTKRMPAVAAKGRKKR